MATQDEILRLVLQVQGQAEVASLEKQADALRKQIVQLGSSASASDPKLLALGTKLQEVEAKAKKLEDQFGRAQNKLAGLGQAGLQTGRVMQDLAQGGIGGIINNIEGFVQSVGAGPGLAGVRAGRRAIRRRGGLMDRSDWRIVRRVGAGTNRQAHSSAIQADPVRR